MRTNIVILFLVSCWSFSASAGNKMNAKLREYHAVNSQVAKILNPKNSAQIKKIVSSIDSPHDRQMFNKGYVSIKGRKITINPFMDRLVITEGGKRHVMQLMSLSPLKVKMNDFAILTIDKSNIYKSISKATTKPTTASMWDHFLPSANASGESDWLFMYSAVATHVADIKKYNGKLEVDDQAFSDAVDDFLKTYDIKQFNCSYTNKTKAAGSTIRGGISFTDSKDNRFYGDCGRTISECAVLVTDKSGNFDGTVTEIVVQQQKLKGEMKIQAQKIANDANFNIDDFEVHCEMILGWSASYYPACYLDQLPNKGNYNEDTLEALKTTNLLPDSAYEDQSLVDGTKSMIDKFKSLDKSELTADQGFIMESLRACCKDFGCAAKAKEKVQMSSEPPKVSQ